jgi:hypothetical protein
MKTASMTSERAGRGGSGFRGAVLATAAAALMLAPASQAAEPGASGTAAKSKVVTLEQVPGGGPPRVVLVAKAAERLGIATGKVEEQAITRRQMVGGLVVPAAEGRRPPPAMTVSGGFGVPRPDAGGLVPPGAPPAVSTVAATAPAPEDGSAYVVVMLSQAELDRLDKDAPARVVPLAGRGDAKIELEAQPSGIPPIEDVKRSMLSVRYVVPGGTHGLEPNQRVRVELALTGSDERHKVVPYSAVHYDGKGAAWAYVSPQALTYERQRIEVDRIVGDLAVLKAGPPVGTTVVTTGASMLHGAEVFKK